jgi:hypothetical protein
MCDLSLRDSRTTVSLLDDPSCRSETPCFPRRPWTASPPHPPALSMAHNAGEAAPCTAPPCCSQNFISFLYTTMGPARPRLWRALEHSRQIGSVPYLSLVRRKARLTYISCRRDTAFPRSTARSLLPCHRSDSGRGLSPSLPYSCGWVDVSAVGMVGGSMWKSGGIRYFISLPRRFAHEDLGETNGMTTLFSYLILLSSCM